MAKFLKSLLLVAVIARSCTSAISIVSWHGSQVSGVWSTGNCKLLRIPHPGSVVMLLSDKQHTFFCCSRLRGGTKVCIQGITPSIRAVVSETELSGNSVLDRYVFIPHCLFSPIFLPYLVTCQFFHPLAIRGLTVHKNDGSIYFPYNCFFIFFFIKQWFSEQTMALSLNKKLFQYFFNRLQPTNKKVKFP